MKPGMLASKVFELADQQRFAGLTGDRNPMHLDAVVARRTQAGTPAVHGMHLLLWALDIFARLSGEPASARSIKVRFKSFVGVGDAAQLNLLESGPSRARFDISVSGVTTSQITVDFGENVPAAPVAHVGDCVAVPVPARASDLDFDAMRACLGTLQFAAPVAASLAEFPHASRWIGAGRVAALGASSALVGMVCPGLHSIYGSLAADLVTEDLQAGLEYRVVSSDERFRLLRIAIVGGGIAGTVETLMRSPPATQPTMLSLAGLVSPGEFAGSTALVVGGSRGIGELVAKLVAAGGGRVLITHRVGKGDAQSVMDQINAAGGDCASMEYDVRKPAAEQLAALRTAPTHLYYFATPVIYRQQKEPFNSQRLRDFLEFYVDGFWDLLQHLHRLNPGLSVFYPSTVFVAERPRGMTEYVMAKGAGEVLCARLNESLSPLRILVSRLPRLATDQTASNLPVETLPALETLLPLVRQVQGAPPLQPG